MRRTCQRQDAASNVQMFIGAFILFSFMEERTIANLFNSTVINPRLYDIGFLLALLSILAQHRRARRTDMTISLTPFRPAIMLFLVFILASINTVLLLYPDPAINRYSLWFIFRYFEVAAIGYYFFRVGFSETQWRRLYLWFVFMSLWPIANGYGQLLNVIPRTRLTLGLQGAQIEMYSKGLSDVALITSTLGSHSVHIAGFAALAALLTSYYVVSAKNLILRVLAIVYMFLCIPLPILSGSRAGLFAPLALFGTAAVMMHYGGKPQRGMRARSTRQERASNNLLLMIVVFASVLALALFYLAHTSSFGHIRTLDILRPLEERVAGGAGADPISRFMVGPRWLVEQCKEDDWLSRLVLGDGFYGRTTSDHAEGGWGVHSSLFFPWQQAGVMAFIAFWWLLARVSRSGVSTIKAAPRSEKWRMSCLASILPAFAIIDLGSGSGIVWTNILIVTGTSLIMTLGVVMPWCWGRAMVQAQNSWVSIENIE